MVKMRDHNKSLKNEEIKLTSKNVDQENGLDFNLWKEELNKELESFWKLLKKSYEN